MLRLPSTGRLSAELIQALDPIKEVLLFSQRTTLFREGSPVPGLYLVESGEVRILLSAGAQRKQLLEVVGPGALLGLSESLSGGKYAVTAEVGEQTAVSFITKDRFRELMLGHGEYCMQIVRLLSEDLHGVYSKFRGIGAHPGRPRLRKLEELN